jgi:hypothetical protein
MRSCISVAPECRSIALGAVGVGGLCSFVSRMPSGSASPLLIVSHVNILLGGSHPR